MKRWPWPYNEQRARRELIILIILNAASLMLFVGFDVFERMHEWLHSMYRYEAEELLLLGVTLSLSLTVFSVRRMREARGLMAALIHLSESDDLTGLSNRRHANEVLQRECERSQRTGRPFSLLLLDLDHFKTINDSHGHAVGDQVLETFATLLLQRARQLDTVARWGGEEFLLICPETNQQGALTLAESLRKKLSHAEFPRNCIVTASIGVATLQGDDDPQQMLHRADLYLYAAKHSGRNRVVGEAQHAAAT